LVQLYLKSVPKKGCSKHIEEDVPRASSLWTNY